MHTARFSARRAALSIMCFMLLTACANQHDIAYQTSKDNTVCLDLIDRGIECSVASIASPNVRDLLPEFTQQLLPIHQREEIIEQEIEDSRNKH
ncbi:MAG: hypothetical protein ACI96N_003084 [Arenicella sp.]|jgi:hypothetical protein